MERVTDYIIANYNNDGDIKVSLRNIQDPKPGFKIKHKPTILTDD